MAAFNRSNEINKIKATFKSSTDIILNNIDALTAPFKKSNNFAGKINLVKATIKQAIATLKQDLIAVVQNENPLTNVINLCDDDGDEFC